MTPFKYAHSDADSWAGIARALVDGLLGGEDLTHDEDEALLGFLWCPKALDRIALHCIAVHGLALHCSALYCIA